MPRKYRRVPPEVRFWNAVDKRRPDDCWFWLGHLASNGYGEFWTGSHNIGAHRYSYGLANGHLDPTLMVLHSCDVRVPPGNISYRACVNPGHLSQGTSLENTQQARERGRNGAGDRHKSRTHPESVVRGEQAGNVLLTEAQVRDILARYVPKVVTLKMLGDEYGVHFCTISAIVNRRNWKHVNPDPCPAEPDLWPAARGFQASFGSHCQ